MSKIIEELEKKSIKRDIPEFRAGDTVSVDVRILEGKKERIQNFTGVVIQIKGSGISKSFTVRKISQQIAVERIFPMYSPHIRSITLTKKGRVRRSRIYYLRELKGKASRIKERS